MLGLLLLALQVFGYGSMDLVVFALTICAIAILMFSLFCVIFGGLLLQLRVRRVIQAQAGDLKPLRLEAGFPNETGFSLPDLGFFPLIKLSWRILYPDQLETRLRVSPIERLIVEEIVPLQRCRTGRIIRLFTVSDVLGFCRYSWRQGQPVEMIALPRSNSIRALPLLRSLTAEDGIPSPSGNPEGDRMEIRPYVPGDSVRNIMWKVYARNRQLNVRLSEKSVFHSNRTVAYLLSGEQDEAAAAVARVAVESGALGDDWVFGADGTDIAASTVDEALFSIASSRALDEPFGYGLDDFLSRQSALSGTHCVVFAAAVPGPWMNLLRQSISRFRGQFSLVLATDGFDEASESRLWQRVLLRSVTEDGTPEMAAVRQSGREPLGKADVLRLLTELGQLVESTLLVDRTTGLSFDQSMRKV